VSTDVTTGMPALPTPTGQFHILAKYSPYRFVSPWPRGSPYYYDPLWVDYAMLFANGGYFIHDAWWQPNFGPGANVKTGSHGCVNVPPPAMPALYSWARVGDNVVVTN
jgi:lipoprotein-anchoring transpeptidase ErfK/SrfK